ncbi:hypothetical protein LQV63_22545 [Paenibacillus profundus]|uniref:Lipoprotein n=1 Tax=Paenibacillus profundus TaxID=1173085 RepID=A0ABS8YLJ1_9BACL|nr:hypothetical protein [Paenibacillus profundus]MCE5172064.1 hypothetical protein [Paenibacillus profundus]
MNLLNDNKPLISRACLLFVTLVLIIAGCSSSKTDETNSKIEPVAAIYYSTDLPNEKIGDGLSYLFLIDQQGKHMTIKKRGLELNSIIPYKGALLLNQKNELLSIKQDSDLIKSTSFEEDCKVYAGYGQSSGQVNDQNTFYSIYNQSFSSDRKHYISKIRWGDQTNNYCKDINEYIEVSGDDGSSIYFISSETEDGNKKSFHKLSLENDKLIMTKTFLEQVKTDGRFMFTKLIPYSNDMVGIYADLVGAKVELNLIQIDKDNKTPLKKHPLVQYDRSNSHYYFFNKESIYVSILQ